MDRSINSITRKRVAVVGSGCAGTAALWALNRTYHDVYLYEAASRLGGQTNTVQWTKGKFSTAVDTGFVVFNTTTYPNFVEFIKRLGLDSEPTEVSLGVSRDHGLFEWASTSLRAAFSQRRNLLSPRMWRILFDIVRFNQFAIDILIEEDIESARGGPDNAHRSETIGQYLEREGYSTSFENDYLLPLISTIWNASPEKSFLDFPAVTLVRFLWNHYLVSTSLGRLQWLTLRYGSKSYVDAVMKGFPPNHLFTNTSVRSLSNDADGRVRLHFENGKTEVFDHVVLATHGDQALSIINTSATEEERSILSCFRTSQTEAVLHSDTSHMPSRRKAWAGLNCRTVSAHMGKPGIGKTSLTCNMNWLQNIPRDPFGDVLVTLNPLHQPRRDLIQGRYYYTQPVYTIESFRAQKLLRYIQNTRGISYAGAWTNYGSHEDAFSSGLRVAQEHLGAKLPFQFQDSTYSRGKTPRLGMLDHTLRLIILILQVFVVQILEWLTGRGRQTTRPNVNGKLRAKA
ncbi:putative NAD/FAD-binding protein, partial [Geosmithia morbida]